jgi:hypothetical protein
MDESGRGAAVAISGGGAPPRAGSRWLDHHTARHPDISRADCRVQGRPPHGRREWRRSCQSHVHAAGRHFNELRSRPDAGSFLFPVLLPSEANLPGNPQRADPSTWQLDCVGRATDHPNQGRVVASTRHHGRVGRIESRVMVAPDSGQAASLPALELWFRGRSCSMAWMAHRAKQASTATASVRCSRLRDLATRSC